MTEYCETTSYVKQHEPVTAPSLDLLCQDLDTFINELSDQTPTENRLSSSSGSGRLNGQALENASNDRPPQNQPSYNAVQHDDDDDDDRTLSPLMSPSLFPPVPNGEAFSPPVLVHQPYDTPVPTRNASLQNYQEHLREENNTDEILQEVSVRSIDNRAILYTTRTTSLDRQEPSSRVLLSRLGSTASRTSSSDGSSRPTSPPRKLVALRTDEEQELPNHAILSDLAHRFVLRVKHLNRTRRIFCTDEYPMSFTGEEAVKILRDLLNGEYRGVLYRKVARTLMRISPPLISPIAYSERSLKNNTLYDSSNEVYTIVESTLQEGFAQGVFTAFCPCYSRECQPGQGGCYSPCCPNRTSRRGVEKQDTHHLRRNLSLTSSSVASSHDTSLSRAWQASVPREILQSTPEQEIKRQEAISELIYTEEDYVRDLNLLDDLFAKSLRTAQCIDVERRDAFCDNVFNNYLEILSIHRDLYRDMRDYQSVCQARSAGGFVDQIGNIFLRHLHRFMSAYTTYGPHVVLAEYAVKQESNNNILFQNFIREKERQAECRRLPFRHFLVLPVTRLQRYSLLLDAILKRTQDDHPDKDDIARCIEIVREIGSKVDELAANKRNTLRIYIINDSLRFKPGQVYDLRLSERGRRLLHEGPLKRRSHMGVDDLHVFLFDHMLIMTKPKGDRYHLSKRPIPLQLLHLRDGIEAFSLGVRNPSSPTITTENALSTSTSTSLLPAASQSTCLVIQHLGRHGGDYLLYAESSMDRILWKEKVIEAKAAIEKAHPEWNVFEIRSLSDTTFALNSGPSSCGKVTCSTAFIGARGIRMVAIGTEIGVWMGIEGDTNNLQKVLSVNDVTQIGVLEEYHIFLVLADKTLTAYALDSLDPTTKSKNTTTTTEQQHRPSYKIQSNVVFFNTGTCNNRTLVITMKKRGLDSLFKSFEPVCGDLRDPRNAKFLNTKTGFLSKGPSWFKLYKEFYVGADALGLQFLKARLAVVCVRGFEIIDLNHLSLQNHNLPELRDPDFVFVQERREQIRPLGMFRCRDGFLLCYDAFAFMVNSKGLLMKGLYPIIDWEGVPQAVAFSYPYVIGFDPRFIEVRHVETGALVQVFAGENMRCLHYRQNAITPPVIHGCMSHPFRPGYQYVFNLVGTFEPPLVWHI